MAVEIKDIRISNPLCTGETKFILGNVGDKIKIEVDIEISENVISTASFEISSPYLLLDDGRQIRIRPLPEQSDEVFNDDLIWSSDPSAFANFRVGDVIIMTGTRQEVSGINAGSDGNYIITEKIGDQKIRVIPDGAFALQPLSYVLKNSFISLFTPVQGVSYFYNFIENEASETFESLVDGEVQNLKTNSANANDLVTQVPMSFNGKKSYQIGDATIVGRGLTFYGGQLFTITHNTFITPLFLASQLNDLQNNIAPNYLENGSSLSFALSVEAGRNILDQNSMQSSTGYERLIGNVGWFNENFNGIATNYFVEDVVFSSALNTIEIDVPSSITFKLKNTVDSPFVDTLTPVRVGVFYMPENESEYQANGKNLGENFLFDEIVGVVGSNPSSLIGRVFQDMQTTFISSTEIELTVNFVLSAESQQKILEANEKNFVFFVSAQDHTKDVLNSDRVSLIVAQNKFDIELTDANLITSATSFLQHYTNVDTTTSFCANPVDDIVAKTEFSIDFAGKETEGIKIIEIQNNILLKHATEDDVVLESTVSNVSGSLLNGLGQFITIQQDRNFKLDSGDLRKQISITSNTPSGTVYSWSMSYPFINRFEYWESLNLNSIPAGLFDVLEPNNGLNQDWFRLASQAGWSVYYQARFIIEQNGQQFQQEFDSQLDEVDFESNPDWTNELIETFDSTGAINYNNKIVGFEDTLIKANFEWAGVSAPLLEDVEIVIWINTKEVGGINTIFKASSVYELETLQPFKSIDASNKVVVSESGGVFTGEVFVDYTKITPSKDFTLYARLYDKTTIPVTAKLLENGELKTLEDAEIKIIE